MTLFAKLREGEGTWEDQELRDLEGNPLTFIPRKLVKVIGFDSDITGLYVLTDNDDGYFTCHSICLDFVTDIQLLEEKE